jgi:ABC-type Fe3+-citrate transport system substrate-binding protein
MCGLKNVFTHKGSRYPEVSSEELATINPELILLSSEPFPFKEKHVQTIQNICPKALIKIVDGELFSWYGSRLKKSPDYFKSLF